MEGKWKGERVREQSISSVCVNVRVYIYVCIVGRRGTNLSVLWHKVLIESKKCAFGDKDSTLWFSIEKLVLSKPCRKNCY